MISITHNGLTIKLRASLGVITKHQANRLLRIFDTRDFDDGHQLYRDLHGADNCWLLRKLPPPGLAFRGPR